MIALYGFLSRISGCMAGVCAVLALLATPSSGRADDASECTSCCTSLNPDPMAVVACYGQCMEGSGPCASVFGCNSTCAVICGPATGGPGTGMPCTGNCTGQYCHFGCGCSQKAGCGQCG